MHNQGGGDRDWTPVQGRLPTHSHLSELEISLAEGGSSTKKEQSALTVVLQLVISGLTGLILIVLSAVNLLYQGRLLPLSLRPVLRTAATYVMARAWSSGS